MYNFMHRVKLLKMVSYPKLLVGENGKGLSAFKLLKFGQYVAGTHHAEVKSLLLCQMRLGSREF